eukprot:scaffold41870_cov225-Isochrysis_galbana.AAC.2
MGRRRGNHSLRCSGARPRRVVPHPPCAACSLRMPAEAVLEVETIGGAKRGRRLAGLARAPALRRGRPAVLLLCQHT